MARSQSSDPLHGFRFHVKAESEVMAFTDPENGEAGFQSVTLPELSTDIVEYKEGIHTYTKKFPGIPTVSDMTLMRGVTKTDTAFFDWVLAAIEGGEYRTNLTVYHWHRDGKTHGQADDLNAARKYNCYECVPMRCKPAADLESQAGEVSLAEVDVAVEWFAIENAS